MGYPTQSRPEGLTPPYSRRSYSPIPSITRVQEAIKKKEEEEEEEEFSILRPPLVVAPRTTTSTSSPAEDLSTMLDRLRNMSQSVQPVSPPTPSYDYTTTLDRLRNLSQTTTRRVSYISVPDEDRVSTGPSQIGAGIPFAGTVSGPYVPISGAPMEDEEEPVIAPRPKSAEDFTTMLDRLRGESRPQTEVPRYQAPATLGGGGLGLIPNIIPLALPGVSGAVATAIGGPFGSVIESAVEAYKEGGVEGVLRRGGAPGAAEAIENLRVNAPMSRALERNAWQTEQMMTEPEYQLFQSRGLGWLNNLIAGSLYPLGVADAVAWNLPLGAESPAPGDNTLTTGELFSITANTIDLLIADLGERWKSRGDGNVVGVLQETFSPSNFMKAFAVSQNGMLQALTPTPEQRTYLAQADPNLEALALAEARSMSHHGVPSYGNQYDNIINAYQEAEQLQEQANQLYQSAMTMLPGPERERALFQAAEIGAQAHKLRNKHPAEFFDENWSWQGLAAEMLLDPWGMAETGLKAMGLTPIARRAGVMRKAAAAAPGELVEGVNQPGVLQWATDWLKDVFQLNRSKAQVGQRYNFMALGQLTGTFDHPDDIKMILKTYATNPAALVQGIPTTSFKSTPELVAMQAQNGMIKVPDIILNNIWTKEAQEAFAKVPDLIQRIDSLPSLNPGAGNPVNVAEFTSDLYELLGIAMSEVQKVNVFPTGTLAGARKAKIKTVGGQTVIEWLDDTGQRLGLSQPMNKQEALKTVQQFQKAVKTGEPFGYEPGVMGTAEWAVDGLRKAMGWFTINNPLSLGTQVTNGVVNRWLAWTDSGIFGLGRTKPDMERMARIFDGIIPDDTIAAAMDYIRGDARSLPTGWMAGEAGSNKNPFNWMKNLRLWDEQYMRTSIISKSFWTEMEHGLNNVITPALREHLQASGMTDPKAVEYAVSALRSAALDGKAALLRKYNEIANGLVRPSVSGMVPDANFFLPDDLLKQIDDLVGRVTPETLDATRLELNKIRQDWTARIDLELSQYGMPSTGRHFWTRKEMWQQGKDYYAMLETVAKGLGEDYKTYAMPRFQAFQQLQDNLSKQFYGLFQMAATDVGAVPYLRGAAEQLEFWRNQVWQQLDQLATHIRSQPPAARAPMWKNFETVQDNAWQNYGTQARTYLTNLRDWLFDPAGWKAGAPPPAGVAPWNLEVRGLSGPDAWLESLQRLAADEGDVFRLTPKSAYSGDPLFLQIMTAGKEGLAKYEEFMMLALQNRFTQDGVDHLFSAYDDVAQFRRTRIDPLLARLNAAFDAKRAQLGIQRGQPIPPNLKKRNEKLWDWKRDEGLKIWKQYFEYAYARYDAGAKLIYGAGGGLPPIQFMPSKTWPMASKAQGPLQWVNFNLRAPGRGFVKDSRGKLFQIDLQFIPPDAMTKINEYLQAGERLLADGVGNLAGRVFDEMSVPVDDIQQLIGDIRSGRKGKDVWDALQTNIGYFTQSHRPAPFISDNYPQFFRNTSDSILREVDRLLPDIAQANTGLFNKLPTESITDFNANIVRLYDQARFFALKQAQNAAGFTLVDMINQYTPDVLFGAASPYLYWVSRQGKNMLERMAFHPGNFSRVNRWIEYQDGQHRAEEGLPQRARGKFATGLTLPSGEELYLSTNIPKWTPVAPWHILNGWADVDRANRAQIYLLNNMNQSAYPAFVSDPLLWTQYQADTLQALGISIYPWWDAGLSLLSGDSEATSWAQFGLPAQLLGWSLQRWQAGQSPESNPYRIRLGLGPLGGLDMNTAPIYSPSLTGRLAADHVQAGNLPLNIQQQVAAVAQAQREGRPLDPGFLQLYPDALKYHAEWAGKSASNNFLTTLLNSLTGIGGTFVHPGEVDRNLLTETYNLMGYTAGGQMGGNPTGGKIRTKMYDEESEFYEPGRVATSNAGAIGGGLPALPSPNRFPFLPDYEAGPLDQRIIVDDYSREKEAIYNQREEAMQQYMRSIGGQVTEENMTEVQEYNDKLWEEANRRLEELEKKWEGILPAQDDYERTTASLRGASPMDTRQEAIKQLYKLAESNVGGAVWPGDDATSEQKRAYYEQKEAIEAEFKRLAQDPDVVSDLVFERPVPGMVGGVSPLNFEGVGEVTQVGGQPAEGEIQAPPYQTLEPTGQVAQPSGKPSMETETTGEIGEPLQQQMQQTEQDYGLPSGLLPALLNAKSGSAQSGRVGIFKIPEQAAADIQAELGMSIDANDPKGNALLTGHYLNWLNERLPADKKNDIFWIIAAAELGQAEIATMQDKSELPPDVVQLANQTVAEMALNKDTDPVSATQMGGTIDWGTDLDTLFNQAANIYDSPFQAQYELQLAQAKQQREERVQALYPKYYPMLEEYLAMSEEEREEFRLQNPEITAVTTAYYNKEGWEYIEQTWGEGTALKVARIPPYQEGDNSRALYFQRYPEAFLAQQWLRGRPYDEDTAQNNNGRDYEQAKEKFGENIWDIVALAKTLPVYDKNDKSTGRAWGQFHDKYPQYEKWSDWWYADISDVAVTSGMSEREIEDRRRTPTTGWAVRDVVGEDFEGDFGADYARDFYRSSGRSRYSRSRGYYRRYSSGGRGYARSASYGRTSRYYGGGGGGGGWSFPDDTDMDAEPIKVPAYRREYEAPYVARYQAPFMDSYAGWRRFLKEGNNYGIDNWRRRYPSG